MSFIPNTDADRLRMLEMIGAASTAELFRDVPEEHRFPVLDLPAPVSELEALTLLHGLAGRNTDCGRAPCFLGAGAYHHFIPSVVDFVVSRSEFSTAYTPYQPEISQGTLQAIFEYQSLIARLTGMEVSNASHYDGATSLAEAVIMAVNVGQRRSDARAVTAERDARSTSGALPRAVTAERDARSTAAGRTRVVMSPCVHPQYRDVVRTYTQGMDLGIREAGKAHAGVETGLGEMASLCDASTACVVLQNPDFFGRIASPQRVKALADTVHARGSLLVIVANPVSLGLLAPPGELGADIVVGEGQALGNSLSFGGPYLGFFAFRREHIRRSSGRISGQTADREGKRGYVFTLSTREQHIRREKATSNICTNQSLNALAAAAYLTALGPGGLRRVAELCWHKAHYAARRISRLRGWSLPLGSGDDGWNFFHEFVARPPLPVECINRRILERHGIIGGYDLGKDYPDLEGCMLLCCTEMNTRQEIDLLASALEEAGHA